MSAPRRLGIISRIYGAYYDLRPLDEPQTEYRGRLRGKLRLEHRERGTSPGGLALRHLLIVGDLVEFRHDTSGRAPHTGDPENSGHGVLIEALVERRNAVFRSSPHEVQALGANLDRALVVMSLAQPPPRTGFLDRFLASCHAAGVPAGIVFTKPDLVEEWEREEADELVARYSDLGYEVSCLDLTRPGTALASLLERTSTGRTLLAGQSGTGKSTLLNLLLGRSVQKTGDISESTGKGRHTTTNSSLYLRDDGPGFIDTPGVKEWGVQHLSPAEILASFPELAELPRECRYADCHHSPGTRDCAVQAFFARLEQEGDADDGSHPPDDESHLANDGDDAADGSEPRPMDPERLDSLRSLIASLEISRRIRTGDYIKPTGRVRTGKLRPPGS